MNTSIETFGEFYRQVYLPEHAKPTNRWLHFTGSLLGLIGLGFVIGTQRWWAIPLLFVIGYGFAWVGHFVVEKNRPATFRHPLWSFVGDWVMFSQMLRGRHWRGSTAKPPA